MSPRLSTVYVTRQAIYV